MLNPVLISVRMGFFDGLTKKGHKFQNHFQDSLFYFEKARF